MGARVTGELVTGRGVVARLGGGVGNKRAPLEGRNVDGERLGARAHMDDDSLPVGYTDTSA